MTSLAVNLHCHQARISSWPKERPSSTPMLLSLLQQGIQIHQGLQWSSTPTGGARPKVSAWPPTAQSWPKLEEPDPTSLPHRWIHVEMMKITHCPWWKELKASRRMTVGSHIISEGLTKPEALHWTHWQAVAFWLPLAQQEASGWWDAPPRFCKLHQVKFLTHTNVSGPRNFWTVRQEKTLALAQTLQACAVESGFPTGFFCKAAWELQKYMAPLIDLSGDVIVKASLLRHTGEEHRASLHQRMKPLSWEKLNCPKFQTN